MADWDPDGELGRALATMRVHDAPRERVERIRSRCAASLAARRPGGAPARPAAAWRSWLEPLAALGLGLLYIADAVSRALEAYR